MSQPGKTNPEIGPLETAFSRTRRKLSRMVQCRMDPRLAARVDSDDVLQEAWIEAVKRVGTFAPRDATEELVWLRQIVGQTLVDLHRRHLGAQMRSAGREARLHRLESSRADSETLSALLVASLTSPSHAAMRAEANQHLEAALRDMDETDREIIALRHFEELSNDEVAAVLGLTRSTASYRYIRALSQLKRVLDRSE